MSVKLIYRSWLVTSDWLLVAPYLGSLGWSGSCICEGAAPVLLYMLWL